MDSFTGAVFSCFCTCTYSLCSPVLINLASVLSHRVCLSPPLSCFCTEHCECVPRGLLLYRRPVTLIDFTLSHFLSRCHSLSYPHSHLLPITGISVCTLRATVLSLFFMYCIMYGKRVRIDILIILEIEFTVLQGVLPQVVLHMHRF